MTRNKSGGGGTAGASRQVLARASAAGHDVAMIGSQPALAPGAGCSIPPLPTLLSLPPHQQRAPAPSPRAGCSLPAWEAWSWGRIRKRC